MAETKLQQHRRAMQYNGFSPYFGWVFDGKMVSQADYIALDSKRAAAELLAQRW